MKRFGFPVILILTLLLFFSFGTLRHNLAVVRAYSPNYRPDQLPTLQQIKLLAADRAANDGFGISTTISADGNTALIGAYQEDDSGTINNGAAYIYIRSGGTWVQQAKLLASDKANNDLLGQSVALSADGNTALVGASNRSEGGLSANGAAYVFTRSGTTWTQQAKLLASDRATSDSLGYTVSLTSDGNMALAGAPGKSDGGLSGNGAAYVFTRSGTTWTQQAKLLASDRASNDGFGLAASLSTDGTTALLGAYGESDTGTTSNGAAYVFTRSGTTWTQQAKLLASDKANTDLFGISVTLSNDGNTALIGAYLEDDSGTSGNGAAYVFTRSGTTWTQQTKLLAADKANNDDFGQSVALSANGNVALVGAVFEDDPGTTNNGAAYIFTRSGTTWTQQSKLLAADKGGEEYFGRSVALSGDGNNAIIGASQDSDGGLTGNGAAYVFTDPTPIPTATPTSTPTSTATSTPTNTATFTNTPIPPHPDTIGVYKDGIFYLRNSNTSGVADISAVFGGDLSDLPVVGDWNSDGVDTIGVYNTSTGVFSLSDSNTAPTVSYTLVFGNPGDAPFAGHWTVDTIGSGVGVYRNSNGILYQRKSLTSGFDDFFAVFGNPGDQPVAGDWNNDGFDSIGVYRASSQTWYLSNNSQPSGITFSDLGFVWDANGASAVAGDWDGDGSSTSGILTANGVFTLLSANSGSGTYNIVVFGPAGSKPIAGRWTSGSSSPLNGLINPGQSGSSNINSGNAD